ncbi:MAG: hypothetical protein D6771_05430, partial [Zetaproteobacteria bacterium]
YGHSLIPAPDADARRLEPLRQLLTGVIKPLLARQGIAWGGPTSGVAAAWTFHTQPLGGTLKALVRAMPASPYTSAASFITSPNPPPNAQSPGTLDIYTFVQTFDPYGTKGLQRALNSVASVVIGAVNLPYYLDAAQSRQDLAPLASQWVLDRYGVPIVKSVQTVPFLMTIPRSAGPWYPVIFQHGFTRSKEDMFAIAGALASAGFATIAIDAPLHGDRTFGLDLVTEDASGNIIANQPDGVPDKSGRHFMNLTHLLTSRDNVRQMAADIVQLSHLLQVQQMDVVNNNTGAPGADGVLDLYTGWVGYVGHSLGGIVGAIAASVDPYIQAAALANPGGNYAAILTQSQTFAPAIEQGLAQKGIQPGSADYAKFFVLAQTIMDDADPLNYPVNINKPVYLLRTQKDTVVPNAATDLLSAAQG